MVSKGQVKVMVRVRVRARASKGRVRERVSVRGGLSSDLALPMFFL